MVGVSIAEDPYGFPTVDAGTGVDRSYLKVGGADELRVAQGDPTATGSGFAAAQQHGFEERGCLARAHPLFEDEFPRGFGEPAEGGR